MPNPIRGTCSIDGCSLPHEARGWCDIHYTRWRVHGDPDPGRPFRTAENKRWLWEWRFWQQVSVRRVDECWPWIGNSTQPGGYGSTWDGKNKISAHRLMWKSIMGMALPPGHVVMHSCDNPPCVNPFHLRAGTPADNHRDMMEKGRYRNQNTLKTHCPKGHEYTPSNTRRDARGRRTCRECQNARLRAATVRNRPQRECMGCGVDISDRNARAIVCSGRCRNRHYRNLERRRQHA